MTINETQAGMYGGPTQEDFRVKLEAAKVLGRQPQPYAAVMGSKQVPNIQRPTDPLSDHATEIRNLKQELQALKDQFNEFADFTASRLSTLEMKVGS